MPTDYFLTIDGVNGGSVSERFEGAFLLQDFHFDISNVDGKAIFSPLEIDLTLESGLTGLFSKVASGESLRSIRLQKVVSDESGGGATVYDLRLGGVSLTKYRDSGLGSDSLSFNFNKVVLTTRDQNGDGSFSSPITTSWNIAKNAPGASVPNPVPSSSATGGGGTEFYYLTVDGMNGGSLSENFRGAFDVVNYQFSVSNLGDSQSGSGGGAGKPKFSPLVTYLDLNAGETSLFNALTTGKSIRSIALEGVTDDGETVYDLKLGNVLLTKYQETKSDYDKLTFNYSKIVLTTTPQNSDGSLGTSVTTSWNIEKNSPQASVPDPKPLLSSTLTSVRASDRLTSSSTDTDLISGIDDDLILAGGRKRQPQPPKHRDTSLPKQSFPSPFERIDWLQASSSLNDRQDIAEICGFNTSERDLLAQPAVTVSSGTEF